MKRASFLPLLAAVAACGPSAEMPPISGAYVRLPAVAGRPAAGYFTLSAIEGQPRMLIGVESPAVQRIELHESRATGAGATTMAPLSRVAVRDAAVVFAPGGKHLMLFGMPREARAGGFLPLVFRFADGSRIATQARIVAAGDPPPQE